MRLYREYFLALSAEVKSHKIMELNKLMYGKE